MFNSHFYKTYHKFHRVDSMIGKNLNIVGDELDRCMDKQVRRLNLLIRHMEGKLEYLQDVRGSYKGEKHAERSKKEAFQYYDDAFLSGDARPFHERWDEMFEKNTKITTGR